MPVSKNKFRMSKLWHMRPLYLCGFLENSFSGHTTFALSTTDANVAEKNSKEHRSVTFSVCYTYRGKSNWVT